MPAELHIEVTGPGAPGPQSDDPVINTLRVLALMQVAESAARQLNLRPIEVIGEVYFYLDSNVGITEFTMQEHIDKVVDHIKSGKPRIT